MFLHTPTEKSSAVGINLCWGNWKSFTWRILGSLCCFSVWPGLHGGGVAEGVERADQAGVQRAPRALRHQRRRLRRVRSRERVHSLGAQLSGCPRAGQWVCLGLSVSLGRTKDPREAQGTWSTPGKDSGAAWPLLWRSTWIEQGINLFLVFPCVACSEMRITQSWEFLPSHCCFKDTSLPQMSNSLDKGLPARPGSSWVFLGHEPLSRNRTFWESTPKPSD